jgi:hypothetical protein
MVSSGLDPQAKKGQGRLPIFRALLKVKKRGVKELVFRVKMALQV